MNQDFEPAILAFVCNWCTYTAADLAGTSRMSQQPNVRLVRMMCTGMVDPKYVIKSLLSGADGVLISGCHPGDCHYQNGNYKARRRVRLLNEILSQFGIDRRRVRLTWVGASEGQEFAATVNNFINDLRELGPLDTRGLAAL
ncbi:hydrogenase iron-sulfur subunit [Desulfomicrobium escambiense]|jgi:coenzyme F420-reducing hydrogenase delta subunit|uniref:hydrogenase iron-sulfur subunit n=1 Tax=Desulfomicrobium escambiense TaxID=29503 RepID=UPI0004244941|nr:hydrogenase iron-sulfur subunit [Desulfomicrobium escambiense]